MKQTDAVEVIYSLLPKMKSAAPEQVMQKYAASRGLSAAQLERLGHVFNTASTLATLEKDRNASPSLVNVPEMVGNYVKETGSAKRASFFAEPEVVKAASAPVAPAEVPNIWGAQREELPSFQTKEAADRAPGRRRIMEHALEYAEQAAEEEVTASSKFAAALDKLARQLVKEEDVEMKFATLKADLAGLNSEVESEMICGKLAGIMGGLGIRIENNALRSAPPVVLHRDRTGFYPQVQAACEHLKVALDAHASLLEAARVADNMADLLHGDWAAEHHLGKKAAAIYNLLEAGGILKEALSVKKSDGDIETLIRNIETGRQDRSFDEPYRASQLIGPMIDRGVASSEKLLSGLNQTYTNTIPGYLDALEPGGAVGKWLEPTATSNQAAAKSMGNARRQIEQDAIAAGNLKKLMITDEILSTKDPEKVFEAFTSIRNAAPEVASDVSMLRLLLRQALETQGVDIDTATAARKFQQADASAPRSQKF